jgi:DNA-binding IclR family transcriptional regulator
MRKSLRVDERRGRIKERSRMTAAPSPVPSRPATSPARADTTGSAAVGSQTLARGLRALQLVAAAPEPVAIPQVAQDLGVHRTIAYRILATLDSFGLLHRLPDGRYVPGNALAALAHNVESQLREVAQPVLRALAEQIGITVSLFVIEGDEAVALSVIEPTTAQYHISFRPGGRHALDHGSAAYALLSVRPPSPGEPAPAARARKRGYAVSHGEVEPGAYGVAVPLRRRSGEAPACINLIAMSDAAADAAIPHMVAAAEEINRQLA